MAETASGATDAEVMALAASQARILLTEDKDFGQLVFANSAQSAGVVLIRFPSTARARAIQVVADGISAVADRLVGGFVVVQPGRNSTSSEPLASRWT